MVNPASCHPRFCIIVILVLIFGAVMPVYAQSPDLTAVARSLDGQLSVRLPAVWMSRDAAAPVFTTLVVFGDTADSLQAMADSLTGVESNTSAGSNGAIGIISAQLVGGLPGELAVSTMLNAMLTDLQNTGGQVLEQQSLMVGGLYPGSVAVVSLPATSAKGLVGAFQAGNNIVEFTMGSSPETTFDANRALFFDILDSVRVPAEEAGEQQAEVVAQATAVTSTTPAVTSEGGLAVSPSGTFSFALAETWAQQSVVVPGFNDVVAFGNTPATMQAIIDLVLGGQIETFAGVGGLIGEVHPSQFGGQPLDNVVHQLMQDMMESLVSPGVSVVEQPAAHNFGGGYSGELALLNLGYIAVLQTDTQVMVAIAVTDDLNANQTAMLTLIESLRLPAESAASQPAITEPTGETAAATTHAVRSSDERLSLTLPENWSVTDLVADENLLAYGDSADAAQSRLAAARPDLAPAAPISGNGGLVILYPMERFGIDPQNPDLGPLMEQALGGLAGYTVEQPAQPLAETGGLFATISGTERGFLALVPFEDQIAYVTATGTQATFTAAEPLLRAVLESVHVPAEAAEASGGLGGLGGLTPVATPTPAGLGGL